MGNKEKITKEVRFLFGRNLDRIERDAKEPQPLQKGYRIKFLEIYKKVGYDSAKKQINSDFNEEMFSDEILRKWIEEDRQRNRNNQEMDER